MRLHRLPRVVSFVITGLFVAPLLGFAADAPKEDAKKGPLPVAKLRRSAKVDFEKEILPIFRRNCLSCHNSQKAEDGVNLETPQTIAKGGDTGKMVEPKKPDSSSLFRVASHSSKPPMPPAGNKAGAKNLNPDELALLRLWIEQGATGEVKGGGPVVWQPLPPGLNPVYAVALTDDGQFAAAGRANQIHLFHLPTATPVGRLTDPALLADKTYARPGVAHRDMTYSLAFSPDGGTLASGSFREVKLWERVPAAAKFSLANAAEKSAQAMAASADGKWLATAEGNSIKLWSFAAGASPKTLAGHTGAVRALKFTPDGARLISGAADKTARVWNVSDGVLFAEVVTPAEVNAVTWLADGKQIATGGADNLIRTWKLPDAAGGKVEAGKEIKGHTGAITALDTFPTAPTQILSGSADASVRVWNADNASQVRTVAHGGPVTAVAVRADGKVFASAGGVLAKLWNAADGKLAADVKGDRGALDAQAVADRALTFANNEVTYQKAALKKSEDDLKKAEEAARKTEEERAKLEKTHPENQKKLAEATAAKTAAEKPKADAEAAQKKAMTDKEAADKAATDADAAAKTAAEALAKAAEAAKPAAEKASKEAADKAKAATDAKAAAEKALADANKTLKDATDKLNAETKKVTDATTEVRKYTDADDAAKRAVQDSKKAGDLVVATKKDIETAEAAQKKADADAAAQKKATTEAEKAIRSIAFSADGKLLATAHEDGAARTWSADTGVAIDTYKGGASAVVLGANNLLAAAGQQITVWDGQSEWKLIRTIGSATGASPLTGRVNTLTFSPDGKTLVTGSGEPSRSGELKQWDVKTGALVREFKNAHSDTVQSVAFSGDGSRLASGAADKFVKVWTVADAKLLKSFEGHTHHVLGVSLKRDGRIVVSAGADNSVKVWSLVTGEVVRTIKGFDKEATSIGHVGVGDQFVATGGDGKVRLINESGGDARSFTGAKDFIYAAAATPDGKIVIAGGQDGVLRVWNGANGTTIATFEPPAAPAPEPQKTAAVKK
jgi:WD40 repeat protein